MSNDDDFQDMLNNLDIVVESMEEGHTIITPRVNHEGRGKTLLELQKELLDPDETAGVEYGTSSKKDDTRGAAKRTGTDALKININTGGGGEGSGGLNV